jgi:hypothetical protein
MGEGGFAFALLFSHCLLSFRWIAGGWGHGAGRVRAGARTAGGPLGRDGRVMIKYPARMIPMTIALTLM